MILMYDRVISYDKVIIFRVLACGLLIAITDNMTLDGVAQYDFDVWGYEDTLKVDFF